MKKLRHVCLLIAMEAEAEKIVAELSLQQKKYPDKIFPGKFYQGVYGGLSLSLLVNGRDPRFDVDLIGPVPATVCAYSALQHLSADVVVSCGTAGGFAGKGAVVGTVYLSKDRCVFHDRRVPLPGFDASAVGSFPVADVEDLASKLGLQTGIISSGSSLQKSDADIVAIQSSGAVAKEMEAAAIAWVCALYATPFFAIKSITNLIDQENSSEEKFVENFAQAVDALTKAVVSVIDTLSDDFACELRCLRDEENL